MTLSNLDITTLIWLIIGFTGQALFGIRLLVQWLVSERQRKSVIPVMFWYFSIAGSLILLAYAVHQRDPVFIVGQSFGLFVYVRNLYLIQLEKRHLKAETAHEKMSQPAP